MPIQENPKPSFQRASLYHLASHYLPTMFVKQVSDLCSILLSFLLAGYMIHYPAETRLWFDLGFLFLAAGGVSYLLGFYRHTWRFTSLHNLMDITKYALTVALGYFIWCILQGDQSEALVKFFLLFVLSAFLFLSLPRILVRMAYEQSKLISQDTYHKAILIGAGKGGELFLREARKHKQSSNYAIEAILDDDPDLWGKKVFGVKVFGPIKDMARLASDHDIDSVIIAIPSLSKNKLLEITKMAEDIGLQPRVLPSFDRLLAGDHVSPEDISVEDLLGRDSVSLDDQELSRFLKDKVIMITGAGGSIGSEICRQLTKYQPKCLVVIDHSEYNLYKITWELENDYKTSPFIQVLADVNDLPLMEKTFATYAPHIVFHAAAYKHVPLLEHQARQAIRNNFFGTKTVAELASKYQTEKFILISTDKAVNPTNVMGATKRMAEIFCQHYNACVATNYITVRFGNVLESAGSVVPLFKDQLKRGGPLTVTHPEITRFFMTIPEASQLVLQAGAMGKGGEIFVLDMGKPIKIVELAERLIALSGKRPYQDINIVFTGLRPGEKLYEELFYENENHQVTHRKKIFLAQSQTIHFDSFLNQVQTLENIIEEMNQAKLLETIAQMVPEASFSGKG
jgi:FlaA1/EpsC-like NDP-sugar epimerase